MKVYIASAFVDKDLVQHWRDRLQEKGIGLSHDWTALPSVDVPETEMPIEEQVQRSIDSLAGVSSAYVLWVLLPAKPKGAGCFVELGYALRGHGSPRIILSGPDRRTIFTSLGEYFATHEEAFCWIVGRRR